MTMTQRTDGDNVEDSGSADRELAELVRVTRLIGSEPTLVLHGGGNSSLKVRRTDVTGVQVDLLLMKASGQDMGAIDISGFAPLRLSRLRQLLPPTDITDDQFANEVRCALTDADAPDPSLETLVHAALPHRAILHSHADAILAITDTEDGEARISEALGHNVLTVPYAMPGVDLAAAVHSTWAESGSADVIGLVVPRHGLFTMGANPEEAYRRHLDLIDAARAYLDRSGVKEMIPVTGPPEDVEPVQIAALRRELSDAAGFNLLLRRSQQELARAVVADARLREAAKRGPITPDHATRTKGMPLVGTDVAAYVAEYTSYVAEHSARRQRNLIALDPAPRVILDQRMGMLVAGPDATSLVVNSDIAHHMLQTVVTAETLGGYRPVSPGHVFDLEYWSLQQKKLKRGKKRRELDGQVAIVTGAASGIGKASAAALLDAGAAVVGWDVSESVTSTFDSPAWLGLQVDVSSEDQIRNALQTAVESFGGLDVLVVGAGIFPSSEPLGVLSLDTWRRTMSINVDSVVALFGLVHPLLALSRAGGRVVVIASKNVLAPGTGAAAYSSSKAALTQLSRVAALEWAQVGIRVNMVHPDAVFDTGLWTPELLASRAQHYGMSVEAYKRRNLLHTEVTSATVGQMVLAMSTEPFRCTTGAQIPLDGGSDRVI